MVFHVLVRTRSVDTPVPPAEALSALHRISAFATNNLLHAVVEVTTSKPCTRRERSTMTTIADLPPAAVRLITRAARTRRIPGTNRFACVCRSWADADAGSGDHEHLQLLLRLEGLPAEAVMSACSWLAQHGSCVTSLDITYDAASAPLFQPLPTAPLVGLARLEVDGPDSLVAMAPALPQLVGLTHLRTSISLIPQKDSGSIMPPCVLSAGGRRLKAPPCLQQLCPGLKSLHLALDYGPCVIFPLCDPRLAECLTPGLEQLHIYTNTWDIDGHTKLPCAGLATALTSLRRLTLTSVILMDPDVLLELPGLEELDVRHCHFWTDGSVHFHVAPLEEWLVDTASSNPQHLTKLTGCSLLWRESQPRVPHPVLAAAPNLQKLDIQAMAALPTAWVEQLSGLRALRLLQIRSRPGDRPVEDMVSALAGVSQLTCLGLELECRVPRATWAAVLPHLTQLRVLAIDEYLLKYGGVLAEAGQLTQLQCLYVHESKFLANGGDDLLVGDEEDGGVYPPPVPDVPDLPSSLKAVLHWPYIPGRCPAPPQQCPWDLPGTAHYSFLDKWRYAAEQGLELCPRPCPHLPGVWELQQPDAEGGL